MKSQIRTYNKIAPAGLKTLPSERYRVSSDMPRPDAILLRSHKLAMSETEPSLLAVARAGAGVNNIPVRALTGRGAVVFNTPGANANAVAELTVAMLLIARRNLYPALKFVDTHLAEIASNRLHSEVEAQKKAFLGSELTGTRLGIIGLGAIGSRIARTAIQMGMEVYGYDPAITVENAWRIPSQCRRCDTLDQLLARSSVITLHVPAVEQTFRMIGRSKLQQVRKGSLLINLARAEIVDEQAVLNALETGQLSGYISDFPSPALCARQKRSGDVILAPHLGASTTQAEENCSVMACRQLRDFLENGNIVNSVNFPDLSLEWTTPYRLTMANANVPRILGGITSALAKFDINITDMANKSQDEVAWTIVDIEDKPSEGLMQALRQLDGVLRVRLLSSGQGA